MAASPEHHLAKMKAMEDAARALFLERGFDAASMEAVAALAGVSKATLYAHFHGKLPLFERVIETTCASLFPPPPDPQPAATDARAALRVLGTFLLDRLVSGDYLAVTRTTLAVSPRQPQCGETLYRHAIVAARALTATVLERLGAAGVLAAGDADKAADVFLRLLTGDFFLRRLLGLADLAPEPAAVEDAVDLFLRILPQAGDEQSK